jgi:hypothetical protein
MTLYSSFLSMAPFILLAVTQGAFGPWGRADGEKLWSYTYLWDVVMVLCVIAGGIVSLLVLGDVVSPSTTTRRLVVVAGCVSLGLLATHLLGSVSSLYRSQRRVPAAGEDRSGK